MTIESEFEEKVSKKLAVQGSWSWLRYTERRLRILVSLKIQDLQKCRESTSL